MTEEEEKAHFEALLAKIGSAKFIKATLCKEFTAEADGTITEEDVNCHAVMDISNGRLERK
jgi:hypothetical protein